MSVSKNKRKVCCLEIVNPKCNALNIILVVFTNIIRIINYKFLVIFFLILWHVDPLLFNDREISSYTTAVARQWLCKQWPLIGNARNNRKNVGSGVFCALRVEVV
jgi:hypothetical protein